VAKANTYVINATDTEGETIIEGVRIVAMTERAAWTEALDHVLFLVSEKHKQGVLVGSLAQLQVTRL
jgi:hypothetical protein